MRKVKKQAMETNPQIIILKRDCWYLTGAGMDRIREEMETKATPLFSKGVAVGYRFNCFSTADITNDLEKKVVPDNEGK